MKTTLPTTEQIKAFTQIQIEQLPCWDDHDKIESGSFAKLTWPIAKSSLVFIIKKETNSVAYIYCNNYNGVISKSFYACSTFLRNICCSEMWVHGPRNQYSDLEYYVTNPGAAI